MFNIGPEEILLILVIALVVLGPNRLPQVARQIGKGLREFRNLASNAQQELRQNMELGQLGDFDDDDDGDVDPEILALRESAPLPAPAAEPSANGASNGAGKPAKSKKKREAPAAPAGAQAASAEDAPTQGPSDPKGGETAAPAVADPPTADPIAQALPQVSPDGAHVQEQPAASPAHVQEQPAASPAEADVGPVERSG